MIAWWKERLVECCVRRCEARKGARGRETGGVKPFLVLARPFTSAYVSLCGHRVRAHPALSVAINVAIKLPFPTQFLIVGAADGGLLTGIW